MIIATFGPSTGWAGKTIDYNDGHFTLEGHGPVSAADVLAYDGQGHLDWAYEGLREWVEQCAAGGDNALPTATTTSLPTTIQQPRRKSRALKVVLIVAGALVGLFVVLVVIGAIVGGDSGDGGTTTAAAPPEVAQPATPTATIQAATKTPTPAPTPTPSAVAQASLAERVAADLSPRTDYTSFDIPTPKVKVEGPAHGGGKVVSITYSLSSDDVWDENALVDGVSPATVDVMAGAFTEPEVKIVDVTWKTDFTDAYGKSTKEAAFEIRWKRKTFAKVDVDGLFDRVATSPEDLYRISDWYSIHPAIWQATHLKDQITMIGGN